MTEAQKKRGPRGEVGVGKPGLNYRRQMWGTPHLRAAALLSVDGRAWLARKAACR